MSDPRLAPIGTLNGHTIDPFNPDPGEIDIEDIAHSLAFQVRFCGHVSRFMSVAQHCVLVSRLCETLEGQRWGLLHDAAEAYISDVPKPLKKHLPLFQEVEDRVLQAIGQRFNLPWPMPKEVKINDYTSLYHEAVNLMPLGPPMPEPTEGVVPETPLMTLSISGSKIAFLDRFYELELGQ
jgi:hypothetical protein